MLFFAFQVISYKAVLCCWYWGTYYVLNHNVMKTTQDVIDYLYLNKRMSAIDSDLFKMYRFYVQSNVHSFREKKPNKCNNGKNMIYVNLICIYLMNSFLQIIQLTIQHLRSILHYANTKICFILKKSTVFDSKHYITCFLRTKWTIQIISYSKRPYYKNNTDVYFGSSVYNMANK